MKMNFKAGEQVFMTAGNGVMEARVESFYCIKSAREIEFLLTKYISRFPPR